MSSLRLIFYSFAFSFFNIILNYIDTVCDIFLCISYWKISNETANSNIIVILICILIPNSIIITMIIIDQFSYSQTITRYTLLKLSLIVLLYILRLDSLLNNFIWLSIAIRNDEATDKNILAELDYVIVMSNMFQVLFNNFPLLIYLFDNLSTKSDQILHLQYVKIYLCIFKLSFYSMLFMNHFIKVEFNIKKLKYFKLIRFLSNYLAILLKTLPILAILDKFNSYGYIYLIFIYLPGYLYMTHKQMTSQIDYNNNRQYNIIIVTFWTIFIALIRMITNFEDSKSSSNKLFVILKPIDFIHVFICFMAVLLENRKENLNFFILFICINLIFYILNITIEFIYWNKIGFDNKNDDENEDEDEQLDEDEILDFILIRYFKKWIATQAKLIKINDDDDENYFESMSINNNNDGNINLNENNSLVTSNHSTKL